MNDLDPSEHETRLSDAVVTYLESLEVGQPSDRARFPELAGFFADADAVRRWTAPLRETARLVRNAGCDLRDTLAFEPALTPKFMATFGDYDVIEELGRGGMGVVYRARQRSLNRVVALKTLRGGSMSSPETLRQLRTEAEAIARLEHAHIVPVYDVGEYEGEPFFSMRLMEGGSLAQRLSSAPLSNREAARVLALLARAMHHAHSHGVIHRDLKPANVLFDAAGQPYLADFGLAKQMRSDPQVTISNGGVVGTACYMSPEQTTAGRAPSVLIDVYGLGAILYETLAGRPPFKAATFNETIRQVRDVLPARPSLLNPQVDPVLEAICLMCLEKTPTDRYESASDLADDLDHYLSGRTTQAERRLGWMGRWFRGVRRFPDSRPESLRTWSMISLWIGLITALVQAGYFALIRIDAGPLAFLFGDVFNWILVTLVFWVYLGRGGRTLGSRERQIVALTQIIFFGMMALCWANLPRAIADAAAHRLTLYPAFMINNGLLYLLQGRLWVGFYLIGSLYMASAFALGFWPAAGPLTFIALHGTCSFGFGLFLRLQASRAARTQA